MHAENLFDSAMGKLPVVLILQSLVKTLYLIMTHLISRLIQEDSPVRAGRSLESGRGVRPKILYKDAQSCDFFLFEISWRFHLP